MSRQDLPELTDELRNFLAERYFKACEHVESWEERSYNAETRERAAWCRGRRSEVALIAQILGMEVEEL